MKITIETGNRMIRIQLGRRWFFRRYSWVSAWRSEPFPYKQWSMRFFWLFIDVYTASWGDLMLDAKRRRDYARA